MSKDNVTTEYLLLDVIKNLLSDRERLRAFEWAWRNLPWQQRQDIVRDAPASMREVLRDAPGKAEV